MTPHSRIVVIPMASPAPLRTAPPAGTRDSNSSSARNGTIAVTPVRATPRPAGGAGSSRQIVACPTATFATSTIELVGPGSSRPIRQPELPRAGARRGAAARRATRGPPWPGGRRAPAGRLVAQGYGRASRRVSRPSGWSRGAAGTLRHGLPGRPERVGRRRALGRRGSPSRSRASPLIGFGLVRQRVGLPGRAPSPRQCRRTATYSTAARRRAASTTRSGPRRSPSTPATLPQCRTRSTATTPGSSSAARSPGRRSRQLPPDCPGGRVGRRVDLHPVPRHLGLPGVPVRGLPTARQRDRLVRLGPPPGLGERRRASVPYPGRAWVPADLQAWVIHWAP